MSDTLTKLVVQIGADVADLKKGMADAQKSTSGFADTFKGVVAGIAASNLGGKVADMAKEAISGFGDLEQSIANISTIKPDIDTSGVFKSLNEMQTRIPQTASQLADSMYNIFSSVDVTQEQAIALTETFAQGAVGAATSAETFGTAALGVMNAYGLAASDAAHISDVFFNTVNKGVVTGQELASSLGPVTQSAKAAGVSLDELGGFIAGVTKEGGPAAQNINNLSNLFQKITTTDAQTAINQLGVATVDGTGKFRPMVDILGDLKVRLGGMTQAAKLSAIQNIFPDAQARQGAMTIMSQLDMVKAAIESNRTATGVAADAYTKMSSTFNAQSALLSNTFHSMLTTIAAEVLPSVTPMISAFSQSLPGAFNTAGEAVAFLQRHAVDLAPVLGAIAAVTLAQVIPALAAEATAVGIAAAAYVAKAAAMAAANLPVAILGAAVAWVAKVVWDEAHAAENAAEKTREMASAAAEAAAKSSPLIQGWAGLASAGASLSDQLDSLNQTHNNLDLVLNREKESLTQLERQYVDANTALIAVNQSTTASNAEVQAAVDKINALQVAQGNVGSAIRGTTAEMDGLTIKAQQMGFELTNAADGAVQYTYSAAQMASVTKEQAQAVEAAAVATAALSEKQRKALADTSPLVKSIEELVGKANSMAAAFEGAARGIDEIAGRMSGAESDIQRHIHSLDAAGSAAKAAFSAENRAAAAEWAQRAQDAATAAGLTGAPLKRFQADLTAVTKYGAGAKGAMDDLTKTLDDQKAPLEDQSKAWADQRTLMADAAKAQLGMGQSLKDLAGEIGRFVDVFNARMGSLPGDASRISNEVVAAFQLSDRMAQMGSDAGAAFAAGLRLQAADAARAARQVADGSINAFAVSLDSHSPSRVTMAIGVNAGEGFVLGLLSQAPNVKDAAGSIADIITEMGHDGSVIINDFLAQFRAVSPSVSSLAQSLASLGNDGLRPLNMQVANFDVAIAQLKLKLANTTAESAEAKAIQEQVDALEKAKGALTAQIGAITAYRTALDAARTASDTFTARSLEVGQNQANTTSFGAAGASIATQLAAALTDPKAGAALFDAVNTLLTSDTFKHLPGSATLAQNIFGSIQRALETHDPMDIQAVLDNLGIVQTQIQGRIDAMKPTFQSAMADALNANLVAEQVGSSWGSVFTSISAAITAGTPISVDTAGKFAADVLNQLRTLPQSMQTDLAPQFMTAWQAFITNPSQEALTALQGVTTDIHTALSIIPKDFAQLAPQVQSIISDIANRVEAGSLDIQKAAQMAGDAAKLIPSGFRRMSPETQAAILTIVNQFKAGALDIDSAIERVNDATNLIPKNLRELTPQVQASIAQIVMAWQNGAIDIEAATSQIEKAIKAAADATAAAAQQLQSAASAFGSTGGSSTTLSTGIQVSTPGPNALGVPGLSASTVTEPGQQPTTTFTYQGQSWAVPGGGSLADIMNHFGFTNEVAFKQWLEAMRLAAAGGGGMGSNGAGLGLFGSILGDVNSLLTALGLPPAPHAAGGVFTGPTTMFDTSGRAHIFGEAGPEPFGSPAKLAAMLGYGGGTTQPININIDARNSQTSIDFENSVVRAWGAADRRGAFRTKPVIRR